METIPDLTIPDHLMCTCGHPANNHANFGVAECDACPCGAFDPVMSDAKRIAVLEKALETMERRIETLIGATCERCRRGDVLFVEPSTGFYTHTLGGNYCDAHKLHNLLNTKASQQARVETPHARGY